MQKTKGILPGNTSGGGGEILGDMNYDGATMDLDAKINCNGCGYDLMGVARQGQCPECGQSYDIDSNQGITRRSAAMQAHERGDRVMFITKLAFFLGLAFLCLALGGWRALKAVDGTGPMVIGGLFGGLFLFAAFVTWFTERK